MQLNTLIYSSPRLPIVSLTCKTTNMWVVTLSRHSHYVWCSLWIFLTKSYCRKYPRCISSNTYLRSFSFPYIGMDLYLRYLLYPCISDWTFISSTFYIYNRDGYPSQVPLTSLVEMMKGHPFLMLLTSVLLIELILILLLGTEMSYQSVRVFLRLGCLIN